MKKPRGMEAWGRETARKRYAEGGRTPPWNQSGADFTKISGGGARPTFSEWLGNKGAQPYDGRRGGPGRNSPVDRQGHYRREGAMYSDYLRDTGYGAE